jgi:aspartate/methionine/tyrosine aminotransferase
MHPDIAGSKEERNMLQQILSLNIRMTIVGAPRIQQRIIEEIGCETTVDIKVYHSRVSRLSETMAALGFDFPHPEGAFYIFACIPNRFSNAQSFEEAVHAGDDPLLYIPGYVFGGKKFRDFVRFSVCVDEDTVERACRKLIQVCKGTYR